MTSSEQIRKWYHEGVVLNHADRGTPGFEPRCNHNHPTVAFPRSGGVYNEPVHPLCKEAFEAYAAMMRAMGINMPGSGGVNACRNIANTDTPSLHAYLCAIDLPPNSFKPTAFIIAIEDIRTNSGAQVFRNLDGDRMHDQINCSPTALTTGIDWSTVVGDDQGDDEMAVSTWAQASWDWAKARFSWSSGPKETVTVEQLMVFLKRYDESRADENIDLVDYAKKGYVHRQIGAHATNPDAHHA